MIYYLIIIYNKFGVSGTEVNHAKAYGRIAFSVPFSEQPTIQKAIKESGNKILTDLITLDTPGKASVRVIILADPVSTCDARTTLAVQSHFTNFIACFLGWTRDLFCG